MCNAVAKLNDLLKFDESIYGNIPCWILSTRRGGNNTLMNFYISNKGFVALDTLMGTPVLVRANDIALM